MKSPKLIGIAFIPAALLGVALSANAYEVKGIPEGVGSGFSMYPSKMEITLAPGETEVRTITVANNTSKRADFKVEAEDFEGANDSSRPVLLLGEKTGKNSLKNFISPELPAFMLEAGKSVSFLVSVSVPKDAKAGGLYGALLVSNIPSDDSLSGAHSISRVGSLFFVRVTGDAKEEGRLETFSLSNGFFAREGETLDFGFSYANLGGVHLVPYGVFTLKNIFGKELKNSEIKPFFVMPATSRSFAFSETNRSSFGLYRANLSVNRGYGNIVDSKTLWFVAFSPASESVFVLLVFLFAIFVIRRRAVFRRNKHFQKQHHDANE